MIKLRMIKEDDIREVLSIYRPYVTNTPISFEYTVPSYRKFTKRVHKITATYPWIVAEINHQIVGYAYTGRFRERAAFAWDAEFQCILMKIFTDRVLDAGFIWRQKKISKLQGIYNIYSLVTSTAKNSIGFHEAMGFERAAELKNCGWKFDHWYGLIYFQKKIGDFEKVPEQTIPIEFIEGKTLAEILEKYSF